MARIESLGEFFRFTNSKGKTVAKKDRAKGPAFGSLLSESAERAGQEGIGGLDGDSVEGVALEELLDAVHSTGDSLKKRQNDESIQGYRRAVHAFLKYVLHRAYETERHQSRPNARRGVQKTYLLVQTVDRKLERLVVDVLRSQLEQLEMLKRIEEINGLLVDLTS